MTTAQPGQPAVSSSSPDKIAPWLQFPRRLILLLLAFVGATIIRLVLQQIAAGDPAGLRGLPPAQAEELRRQLAAGDWSTSWRFGQPVSEIITERLPNTLLLLGTALFVALLLALLPTLIGFLAHKLEERYGAPGSVLKGLGRLWLFSQSVIPAAALGLILVWVLAVENGIFPPAGINSPGEDGLADRLNHLVLPTLTLALLPALLIAQATTRRLTLPAGPSPWRHILSGLLHGLGSLLAQSGAILSMLVVVESLFAWPGAARVITDGLLARDLPIIFAGLQAMLIIVIIARVLAELLHWLGRLAGGEIQTPAEEPAPWRRRARLIWGIVGLLAILLIAIIFFLGITADADAATAVTPQLAGERPSDDYPWGTDRLGRDLWLRARRGAMRALGMAGLAAVLTTFAAGIGGSLAGWLARRRTWLTESISDLILLPVDGLLLFPAVPLLLAILAVLGEPPGIFAAVVLVALVLSPRTMRAVRALWTAVPGHRSPLAQAAAGLGATFLATLFTAFGLIVTLDFLGALTMPPTPALGLTLGESYRYLFTAPGPTLRVAVLIGLCAMALYTAADALIGFFHTKEPLALLNE